MYVYVCVHIYLHTYMYICAHLWYTLWYKMLRYTLNKSVFKATGENVFKIQAFTGSLMKWTGAEYLNNRGN